MNINLSEVREHIELYFKENLPQYTVLEIRNKSSHPDDSHLFVVSAKKSNGTYAVWTNWNELSRNLNHGHYDLKSAEECEKVIKEYTDDTRYLVVYKCSQKVKLQIFIADNEEQARQFCESHGWEWKDENDFLWRLDYREL